MQPNLHSKIHKEGVSTEDALQAARRNEKRARESRTEASHRRAGCSFRVLAVTSFLKSAPVLALPCSYSHSLPREPANGHRIEHVQRLERGVTPSEQAAGQEENEERPSVPTPSLKVCTCVQPHNTSSLSLLPHCPFVGRRLSCFIRRTLCYIFYTLSEDFQTKSSSYNAANQ